MRKLPPKKTAKSVRAPAPKLFFLDQRFLDSSINAYKRVAKSGTTSERLAATKNLSEMLGSLVSKGKISKARANRIASKLRLKVERKQSK